MSVRPGLDLRLKEVKPKKNMFASQQLQSTELLESPRGNSKIMQHPSTSIACRRRKQNLEKQRRTGSKRPWKPRRLCRAPVGKIWGCINTCGTTFVGLNIHLPAILDCFGVHQDTIVFNTHLFNFIYCFGILVRDPHPMRQLEHQACFEFDKAGAKGR